MKKHIVEFTLKSIVLGIILTLLLTAANAYLGLKVGTSVSASIPAAIMALGILRLFKFHNVFEVNLVQTAASTGESLAVGMLYSLPALLMIYYWDGFHYWQSSSIVLVGGILGVLFAIPLRRVLLHDKSLNFPEGTAIGNVLKITQNATASLRHLVIGSISGAVVAFLEAGLKIFSGDIQYWNKVSNTVMGFGLGFSPALIGAGFIMGPRIAVSIMVGAVVGWLFLVPIFAATITGVSDLSAQSLALEIWKTHGRFVGLGVILLASFWTLITLFKPILQGLLASFDSISFVRQHGYDKLPKHEQDFPIHYMMVAVLLLILPILFILFSTTHLSSLEGSLSIAIITIAYILFAGFMFTSICGYLAGMVGATASPVSAMGLAAILIYCTIISLLLKFFQMDVGGNTLSLSAMSIIAVAFVTCMGAIANDTIQDLKAGQMIHATPWKQQLVMIMGVVVAAYSLPLILDLLYHAYGIGDRLPRPDMDINETLAAPQAQLMATIAQGIFMKNLTWEYIVIGMFIAIVGIFLDKFINRFNLSFSTLGMGLGIYLPIESTTALALGGIVALIALRKNNNEQNPQGIMLASGLVTGAALIGVVLAVPFVIFQSTDALRIMPSHLHWLAQILGLVTTAGLCYYMVKSTQSK